MILYFPTAYIYFDQNIDFYKNIKIQIEIFNYRNPKG